MIIGLEWNQGDDVTQWIETTTYKVLYLIKSNNKTYGMDEQGLWKMVEIASLSPLSFEENGIERLSTVTEEQWLQLQKPIEVLTWTDDTESTSVDVIYAKKEFLTPKLELTVPEYKPIDIFDDPEIVSLAEDSESPKLRIEGFRDLRPYMESSNPKLLVSPEEVQEENPVVKTDSVPHRQLVLAKDSIKLRLLKEIQTFIIMSTESLSGIVRLVFSIDGGDAWQTYSSNTQQFETIDISNMDNIKNNGMTADTFNSIETKWNEVVTGGQIKFGYYLEMEDENSAAEVDKLEVVMDVLGSWDATLHETDYNYEYDNEKVYVELYKDGSYKINYM